MQFCSADTAAFFTSVKLSISCQNSSLHLNHVPGKRHISLSKVSFETSLYICVCVCIFIYLYQVFNCSCLIVLEFGWLCSTSTLLTSPFAFFLCCRWTLSSWRTCALLRSTTRRAWRWCVRRRRRQQQFKRNRLYPGHLDVCQRSIDCFYHDNKAIMLCQQTNISFFLLFIVTASVWCYGMNRFIGCRNSSKALFVVLIYHSSISNIWNGDSYLHTRLQRLSQSHTYQIHICKIM